MNTIKIQESTATVTSQIHTSKDVINSRVCTKDKTSNLKHATWALQLKIPVLSSCANMKTVSYEMV